MSEEPTSAEQWAKIMDQPEPIPKADLGKDLESFLIIEQRIREGWEFVSCNWETDHFTVRLKRPTPGGEIFFDINTKHPFHRERNAETYGYDPIKKTL